MKKPHVGMIGLAVMGSNLIKNIESRGYSCAVFNRTYATTEKFMAENSGRAFVPSKTLEEFVQSMEAPRQILLMVKAGAPVDANIESLIPLLDKGDVIADLGNSYFHDTVRRERTCTEKGIHFVGIGVSGGEEGALKGPSIMPGGPKPAWELMAPMLDEISAKAPHPCHAYIGPDGAGHFVKMVHNGIEYGDMQLIAESYHLLREVLGCQPPELASIFSEWNEGVLSSFLVEITAEIFREGDDKSDAYLVDRILDKASQKGTGKWTAQLSLDLGMAIPTISLAVDARFLSALKNERIIAAESLEAAALATTLPPKGELIAAIHDALYISKIISYAQGMAMIAQASKEWNWDLKLDQIAKIWQGGCIIRAELLNDISRAFSGDNPVANLLLDQKIKETVTPRIPNLRKVVSLAAEHGVPTLGLSSSLSYYDSYRTANLPQNLTQAQRDFFGAHTYERLDTEGSFHHQWGSNIKR